MDIGDDIIDSRDVIERIEELEAQDARDEDEQHELEVLQEIASEASGYAADWQHGEALILDSYFEEYAQDLAADIGATNRNATWPNMYIDWAEAAKALQEDYTAVDVTFNGREYSYWIR